jgi:hypothetical protein
MVKGATMPKNSNQNPKTSDPACPEAIRLVLDLGGSFILVGTYVNGFLEKISLCRNRSG